MARILTYIDYECSDEVLLFQFFITSMLSMTMTP